MKTVINSNNMPLQYYPTNKKFKCTNIALMML